MLMGDAFGKSYQYGKRKISAMSNEDFNKLTPADLAKEITADFTVLIPELKIAMQQSTEFQGQIIVEMGNILKTLPDIVKEFIFGTPGESVITPPPPPPSIQKIYDFIGLFYTRPLINQILDVLGITK